MERSYYADAVRRALHLGRDRGHPAGVVRADLSRMIRPVLTEVGIFLIPFAVYALFLIATRSGLLATIFLAGPSGCQAGAGLAAAGRRSASSCSRISTGAPPDSTYVPAHVENGKFVPGMEKPGAGNGQLRAARRRALAQIRPGRARARSAQRQWRGGPRGRRRGPQRAAENPDRRYRYRHHGAA
mgnify:CR=1 FL=1